MRFNEKLVYKDIYKSEKIKTDSNYTNEEYDSRWFKEFEDQNLENIQSDKTEPKKRGRPRKQPVENKKSTGKEKVKEGVTTRSKIKRKMDSLEECKSNCVTIKDTSFASYAKSLIQSSSVEEKVMIETELRHCLLAIK